MSHTTNIEWTQATWNIARGCSKVNTDCLNCYMYRDSLKGTRYNPKLVAKTKTVFNMPLKLKKPTLIFASSLTDFFHPDCDSFREEAWDIIRKTPQHTYQILTKRPERIMQCLPSDWGDGWEHVWIGVSIGHQGAMWMLDKLADVVAKYKFVSFEPLVGEIFPSESISKLNWAIIGGESGTMNGKYRARPVIGSISNIIFRLRLVKVPVFVKQLGTVWANERKFHNDRHGRDIQNFPKALQVREFPAQFSKHFGIENNT